MAKRLAGKRWFEALGQREVSLGRPHWLGQDRQNWPQWAKDAYSNGTWGQMQTSTKEDRRMAKAYWDLHDEEGNIKEST